MKKIICTLLCFLGLVFCTRVYAENLTIEEVKESFNNTTFAQSLLELAEDGREELFDVRINSENHTFTVMEEDNETHEKSEFMTFTYTDDEIVYEDKDTVITKDLDAMDEMGRYLVIANMMLAITEANGYTDKALSLDDKDIFTEEFYNTYGLYMNSEYYEFKEDGMEMSGDFIREFKMSLDKEKIAKLMEEYGVDREEEIEVPEGLAPAITAGEVTSDSVSLSMYVEGSEENEYMCNLYKSTELDTNYELVDNIQYNCSYEGLSYGFDDLMPNQTYYFKAKIVGGDTFSDVVEVRTLSEVNTPNLKEFAIKSVGTKNVKLSWNKVSGAKGYIVYYSTNGKKWKKATTTKSTSYNKKGLKPGTKYYFKVEAYKVVKKKNKTIVKSEVLNTKTKPIAPKVKVKSTTYNSVKINVAKVTGASKYIIERSTDKKNYEKVGELTKNGNYTDKELNTKTKYYYRVKACNERCSSYSKVVSVKPSLKKPTLKVSSKEKGTVKVTLPSVKGADGYIVYRRLNKSRIYTEVQDVDTLTKTINDSELKSKKTYYYMVKAYRLVNGDRVYSSSSKEVKVKVK